MGLANEFSKAGFAAKAIGRLLGEVDAKRLAEVDWLTVWRAGTLKFHVPEGKIQPREGVLLWHTGKTFAPRRRNTFPIAPVWVDIPDAKGTQQAVAWEPECYGTAEWAASDFGLVFFGNQSAGGCGVVECVTYYATCPRDL